MGWTKRNSFSGFECSLLPFVYWRENHALFWSRGLIMYNFNDLSTQGLLIPGYPIVTQAGFYVENLVSLDDHHDFN